jgi:polysaccharide deacetylase 2 family uncharacterized protein YibQ
MTAETEAANRRGQVAADGQAMTDTLERLRTWLNELEAENSELQAELEAERTRRREHEESDSDQGLFGFFQFGASRDG